MKNFMNKPITWGAYLKFAGVNVLLSMIMTGVSLYRFNKYSW